MGPNTEELIDVLGRLIDVLETDGDTHWSAWMRDVRSRLQDSDYSGIEHLLRAYGSMGSFNDLILGQTNRDGDFAWKPGYKELDKMLDEFRERAWKLAQRIRHHHEISDAPSP